MAASEQEAIQRNQDQDREQYGPGMGHSSRCQGITKPCCQWNRRLNGPSLIVTGTLTLLVQAGRNPMFLCAVTNAPIFEKCSKISKAFVWRAALQNLHPRFKSALRLRSGRGELVEQRAAPPFDSPSVRQTRTEGSLISKGPMKKGRPPKGRRPSSRTC